MCMHACGVQVLLIGDSGVGKTCLVMRFISDRFEDHLPSTVGKANSRRAPETHTAQNSTAQHIRTALPPIAEVLGKPSSLGLVGCWGKALLLPPKLTMELLPLRTAAHANGNSCCP